MALWYNNAGTWTEIPALYYKIGGVWTEILNAYVNIDGTWQAFYSTTPPILAAPSSLTLHTGVASGGSLSSTTYGEQLVSCSASSGFPPYDFQFAMQTVGNTGQCVFPDYADATFVDQGANGAINVAYLGRFGSRFFPPLYDVLTVTVRDSIGNTASQNIPITITT